MKSTKKHILSSKEIEKIIDKIDRGVFEEINFKNKFSSIKTNASSLFKGFPDYDEIIFRNLRFSNSFDLINISRPNLTLTFLNCHFNENLIVDGSTFNAVNICQNNVLKNYFDIRNNSNINFILINQDFEIRNLSIYNSTIKKLRIENKSKIQGQITEIHLDHSKFEEIFNLSNIKSDIINIHDCEFKTRIRVSKNINDTRGSYNLIGKFLFVRNELNKSLRIGHSSFNLFFISNIKVLPEKEINIGQIAILEKGEFKLENLRNFGKFKLYNLNFNSIISNPPKEGIRYFSNNIALGITTYNGLVSLANKFNINNSSLGHVEFQNVNFDSFSKVIMYDNTIEKLLPVNVRWMKEISNENEQGMLISQRDKDYQLKEMYRILKIQLLNQKDIRQSQIFESKEMGMLQKMLKHEKSFQEKFILWFNSNSSNFGLSWTLPIFWIFIINSTFFILIITLNLSYTGKFDIYDLGNNIGIYFQLLLPTNSVSEILNNNSLNKIWEALNIIKNIALGVLIYQTIMAFRRYSRK